jgi:hypothetical protein
LDYTKVIILILWWRNFQLEYWRTFQLVSTLSLGYVREKRADKGYSNVYTLWCGNEDIVNNFMRHVPNIAEEAKTNLFEGWEYSDEDFLNED